MTTAEGPRLPNKDTGTTEGTGTRPDYLVNRVMRGYF